MLKPLHLLTVPLLGTALLFATTSRAAAEVEVKPRVLSATENSGFIDVQFQVAASNSDVAAVNVWVRFADGAQISLGDMAAGATAVSGVQTMTIDSSTLPTRNVPVPVKVLYVVDGVNVESDQTLLVSLPSSTEGGR